MQADELVSARGQAIRDLAARHGVREIGWWPRLYGTEPPVDLVVGEGDAVHHRLRDLQQGLERELGCPVVIFLADRIPAELRDQVQDLG